MELVAFNDGALLLLLLLVLLLLLLLGISKFGFGNGPEGDGLCIEEDGGSSSGDLKFKF